MEKKPKKLVLIDGNAIIHRAYHALPPLTTKTGELVNAVYGFSSLLLKVINDLKPDYILATFDLKAPTFRHEEYKEYKATRVKAPDDLYAQISRVKEVTRAFGIPIYEKEGYEADDLIGTLADQAGKIGGIESIIVTGDLDTLQLVDEKTKVYALRRGMSDTVIYDEDQVKERYSLEPSQMTDFKGLRGDPSDNIPGVKGIGEKTATDLLVRYGTLEDIYRNISDIKGAVREKLERDKLQAIMSKRLATIVRDVPVALDLSGAVTHEFDRAKLVSLFRELNFFSLVKRISGGAGIEDEKNIKSGPTEGVRDFKFEKISPAGLDSFAKELGKEGQLAIVLKASGNKYFNSELKGVAICWKSGRAGYVEYAEDNLEKLRAILEDERIKKIGYDLKHISEILEKYGFKLGGRYFDVMLSAYVLNPGSKTELPQLVFQEFGEEIEEGGKNGQLGLDIESPQETAEKMCRRADYVFKLKQAFEDKLGAISAEQGAAGNLNKIFYDIEMPLLGILAEMEMSGVRLNKVIFKGISATIDKKVKNLEKAIYESAGEEFNINSPKQLTHILFEKLKIPTADIKRGKTGFSTASTELAKIRKGHKIVGKIEEYRELFKLKTTYLDTLPELTDEKSRIHTTFNQAVTATGRLSSSDPNLQNIPIRTDLGQLLRTAFEAEKGYRLVGADYSQIDLRVVAHVSSDEKLIETFQKGEDVHRATAAEINKVSPSQVTEKMRRAAKALNFGIIYGMSVFGFSVSAGIDRDEARKFIDEYMEKFEGVARYMREMKDFAKKNEYVETQLGRRRYVSEINSPNFQVSQAAERMAINMPIQGLAADIVKLAMIKADEAFGNDPDIRMILQIHDEIILEVKEGKAEAVGKKLKEIMENAYKLKVPLVVDVKIGDNWGEI